MKLVEPKKHGEGYHLNDDEENQVEIALDEQENVTHGFLP
jgi:hypothetical protein